MSVPSTPEPRQPSWDEICQEISNYWTRVRCAKTVEFERAAQSSLDNCLGLLFEQMTPEQRTEVESRPVNEPVAH